MLPLLDRSTPQFSVPKDVRDKYPEHHAAKERGA
jgi:hypothetical protein